MLPEWARRNARAFQIILFVECVLREHLEMRRPELRLRRTPGGRTIDEVLDVLKPFLGAARSAEGMKGLLGASAPGGRPDRPPLDYLAMGQLIDALVNDLGKGTEEDGIDGLKNTLKCLEDHRNYVAHMRQLVPADLTSVEDAATRICQRLGLEAHWLAQWFAGGPAHAREIWDRVLKVPTGGSTPDYDNWAVPPIGRLRPLETGGDDVLFPGGLYEGDPGKWARLDPARVSVDPRRKEPQNARPPTRSEVRYWLEPEVERADADSAGFLHSASGLRFGAETWERAEGKSYYHVTCVAGGKGHIRKRLKLFEGMKYVELIRWVLPIHDGRAR